MTRPDRVVLIFAYFVSFSILFGLAVALVGGVGPIELVILLLLAVPLCVVVGTAMRRLLVRSGS